MIIAQKQEEIEESCYQDFFHFGYFILGKFNSGLYRFTKKDPQMEVTLKVDDDFFELDIKTLPLQKYFQISFHQRKDRWLEARVMGNYFQIPRFEKKTCDVIVHIGFENDPELQSALNEPALHTAFKNLPVPASFIQLLNKKKFEGESCSEQLNELMDEIENLQNRELEGLFKIHLETTISNQNLNFQKISQSFINFLELQVQYSIQESIEKLQTEQFLTGVNQYQHLTHGFIDVKKQIKIGHVPQILVVLIVNKDINKDDNFKQFIINEKLIIHNQTYNIYALCEGSKLCYFKKNDWFLQADGSIQKVLLQQVINYAYQFNSNGIIEPIPRNVDLIVYVNSKLDNQKENKELKEIKTQITYRQQYIQQPNTQKNQLQRYEHKDNQDKEIFEYNEQVESKELIEKGQEIVYPMKKAPFSNESHVQKRKASGSQELQVVKKNKYRKMLLQPKEKIHDCLQLKFLQQQYAKTAIMQNSSMAFTNDKQLAVVASNSQLQIFNLDPFEHHIQYKLSQNYSNCVCPINDNLFAIGYRSHTCANLFLQLLQVNHLTGPIHTKIEEISTVNAVITYESNSILIAGQQTELAQFDYEKMKHKFRWDHGYKTSDIALIDQNTIATSHPCCIKIWDMRQEKSTRLMVTSNFQNNQLDYSDGVLITTSSCGFLYTGWLEMKEWIIQEQYQYSLKGITNVKKKTWLVGGKSGYLHYCDRATGKAYKSKSTVGGEVKSLKIKDDKVYVGLKDGMINLYNFEVQEE